MNSNEEVKPLQASGTEEVRPSLLDEATTAKLKAPILEANARSEAATEVRTEKYRNAKSLKWELRLEELRAIPKSKRTPDEQREFARLAARQLRAKEKGNDVSTLSKIETAEEFWNLNRATFSPVQIGKWLKIQEIVLDQICWMNEGWECPPHDPCFVSVEDGLVLLEDHISEHGVIHDDPISFKHQTLRDFLPNWGVWALQDIHDRIWGTVEGFWKNPEAFQALCQESEATAVYAKFGIQIGIPAYHLRRFKSRTESHVADNGEHREIVPFTSGKRLFVERCWLCEFERLHGTQR